MSSLPNKSWALTLREWVVTPLALAAITCVVGYVIYRRSRKHFSAYNLEDEDSDYGDSTSEPMQPLRGLRLTKQQLAYYDYKNPDCKYLVALLGVIYDVSTAPHDFGPYGKYRGLSGTDLMHHMIYLSEASSFDWEHQLKTWKMMLEDHFHVAGELIQNNDDKDDTTTAGYGDDNDSDDSMSTATDSSTQPSVDEDADQTLLWNTSAGDITMVPQ